MNKKFKNNNKKSNLSSMKVKAREKDRTVDDVPHKEPRWCLCLRWFGEKDHADYKGCSAGGLDRQWGAASRRICDRERASRHVPILPSL